MEEGKETHISTWIIEPHEPLIFRDGRPFGLNPGARANSLPFPFPSTTTGGTRTQAGLDTNGIFTRTPKEVMKLKVRGPLLVELSANGYEQEPLKWLVPAPADALLLTPTDQQQHESQQEESTRGKIKAMLRRIVPLQIGDALTDLDTKLDPPLVLVGTPKPVPGKPVVDPPSYWEWCEFKKWLIDPLLATEERRIYSWDELGHNGPQNEQRVHIRMDREKHTAKDEALFETCGREFITNGDESKNLQYAHQLALAVIIDSSEAMGGDERLEPRPGFATLGGERRIVNWRRSESKPPPCPAKLAAMIAVQKACRLVLLTPAYFKNGCYPEEYLKTQNNVTIKLQALAIGRPHVVSGWDIQEKAPKPTLRLAPAGTVLFLKLEGESKGIEQWVHEKIWMQCISDGESLSNDGFGLAVAGTWDGDLQTLEKKKQ